MRIGREIAARWMFLATTMPAVCGACGGDARGSATNVPSSVVVSQSDTPDASDVAVRAPRGSASGDGGAATKDAATDPDAASNPEGVAGYPWPLPPPKPITIALSAGQDTPVDKELAAGDLAIEKGALAEAHKHYDGALTLAPKQSAPLVGLARVRIAKSGVALDFGSAKNNREITQAVADLRKAAKLEPAFGPTYVELGRALLLLGDAEGSMESLKKGVQLLPNEAEAHSALGVALVATGHFDEAIEELGRAAKLDAGSPPRHGNYATALFVRGRVKEAIAEYDLQARLADGDARAHADLGAALLGTNELERAVRELTRAVSLDARRATYHSNLGYALQLQGKMSEAIAQYREALRLDDKLVSAWVNLATALARSPKTRTEARTALERARSIAPGDPNVKANLEELDALEKEQKDGGARP
jgi:tetratricopeptide (TPR) repeat protein